MLLLLNSFTNFRPRWQQSEQIWICFIQWFILPLLTQIILSTDRCCSKNAAFPIEFRRDPLWSRPRVDWIVFELCFRDFSLKQRLVQLGRSPLHVAAANHVSQRSGSITNTASHAAKFRTVGPVMLITWDCCTTLLGLDAARWARDVMPYIGTTVKMLGHS